MKHSEWFLHVDGEVLGPISAAALKKMLEQNRCNAADFVYAEGLKTWTRICDCDEFAAAFPPTPKIPVPKGHAQAEAEAEEETPPAPKLKAVPKPVVNEEPAEEEAPAPKVPKPAPKPKAEAKPAPPPPEEEAPEESGRHWRVPIDAKVKINGGKATKVFDISEGGLLFEKSDGLEVGADIKVHIDSPSMKALDLTAVIVREDEFEGKKALGIEFTRMNPAHKRQIAQYVTERLDLKKGKKAA